MCVRQARSWKEQTYLQDWVATIESMGFRFVKHQTLQRTHALMFVASPKQAPAVASAVPATLGLPMRVECEAVPGNEWRLGLNDNPETTSGSE